MLCSKKLGQLVRETAGKSVIHLALDQVYVHCASRPHKLDRCLHSLNLNNFGFYVVVSQVQS